MLLLCGFVSGVRLCHTNVTWQLQDFLAACRGGQKVTQIEWFLLIKEIVAPVSACFLLSCKGISIAELVPCPGLLRFKIFPLWSLITL